MQKLWDFGFVENGMISIFHSGVIKVGYDIQNVVYEADEERKTIFFTLPNVEVLDNYIILDNMQYFAEIQEEELAIAIGKGIFTQAEDQMKSIIENYFAGFPDYRIVFTG